MTNYKAFYSREYYKLRKEEGNCYRCGYPNPDLKYAACKNCRAKQADRMRNKQRKHIPTTEQKAQYAEKQRERRFKQRMAGLCGYGYCDNKVSNTFLCDKHKQVESERKMNAKSNTRDHKGEK